ncbi:DinB family protein [Foetidibacter luteolus]|uniref:DinB family protein n=1 Tax=Foetidibacter luteolus TaxID=2608880 RepID=UPI00129AAE16|nr:DinB family protein [Foetidibacter luteolus]
MPKPSATDHAPYFQRYINLVQGDNITEAKYNHSAPLAAFYDTLPDDKADYAYAPGKWTVKEVLQHVIDTERIFSYRMLRIARNDKTPLPGFDENDFANNAGAALRTLASLKEEFKAVRHATDLLISSLTEEQLMHTGTSNNDSTKANSVAFMVYGHLLHHQRILEERYLA